MGREATAVDNPLRLARQAWAQLHADSAEALRLARRAEQAAQRLGHPRAQAWAGLVVGFHLVYFSTLNDAAPELETALAAFDTLGDRPGAVLATAGLARALWRAGRFDEAIARVMPVRDEGLRVLNQEQRGLLLNCIAGCHSAAGQSEQAFAYMYQALRDLRPARARGIDAVLHCNLAHELLQLGDCHEALRHIDQGLERCEALRNPRLTSVLLINRIICLVELGRAVDALPDIHRVMALPADPQGRGTLSAHFETLAIAAWQAGDAALGDELIERARRAVRPPIADEHLELAVALALQALHQGDGALALRHLQAARGWAGDDGGNARASLRVRCRYWQTLSQVQERLARFPAALEALRTWQALHVEQSLRASRARYQAAALQTELLRLQRKLDENDARRRATERARAALESANRALAQKVDEVQALEAALRDQALRDDLTGLFNRRHLHAVMPGLLAVAERSGQRLSAVMIDLDHFKRVNDLHGHDAGDRLLAAFGLLLAEGCRASDVACRWGGEEFCLLLPGMTAAAARRKVQALLRRWRSQAFALGDVSLTGQSFSAGVADTQGAGLSGATLLKAADDELLLAKQSGRNQVRARLMPTAAGAAADHAPGDDDTRRRQA